MQNYVWHNNALSCVGLYTEDNDPIPQASNAQRHTDMHTAMTRDIPSMSIRLVVCAQVSHKHTVQLLFNQLAESPDSTEMYSMHL